MRRLNVYSNERKAGVLTEMHPGKGYTFCYDSDYLASDQPPISVTLPKRKEPYESEYLFPFFTNILPEGANRKAICRYLRIDEEDFFGLLTAMADQDFIGAVDVRKIKDDNDQ
ncbi:MAG: HipA N-terminal domain-containing protein [Prevotella sp.]|nr:HipA N-terminal domain-containing protein [Prevotella sp.]